MTPKPLKILHVAPHPDDEVIAAGSTLMALQQAGREVSNFAVSLGRPEDQKRRKAELREACHRMGIELILPKSPYGISKSNDLARAEEALTIELAELLQKNSYDLVVAPSHWDGHHGHEVTARAARRACEQAGVSRLWLWGLWADLPFPTLSHSFDAQSMEAVEYAIQAHAGEIERNDYSRLIRAGAEANAILGPERIYGFGTDGDNAMFREILCEVVMTQGGWVLGSPRELDPYSPLQEPTDKSISWWIEAPSPRSLLG